MISRERFVGLTIVATALAFIAIVAPASATSYSVTVDAGAGTGSGSVVSSPAGINCGPTCSFDFSAGTNVTLTPSAASDSSFLYWVGGPCSLAYGDCTFKVTADTSMTAYFVVNPPASTSYTVSVDKAGTGQGTVKSSPAGIDCGTACSHTFMDLHTPLTLTATAASGSTFTGWSGGGGCSGTGVCTFAVYADTTPVATFDANPTSTAKPKITIISKPSTIMRSRSATFKFKSSLPGTTFTCKLDDQKFKPCKSPKTYRHLTRGHHSVVIAAKKGDGPPVKTKPSDWDTKPQTKA
jgi:Divergent InlB B-repeat domain